MSQKVQILRSLVEQSLTAAAEEIFGLFERTVAEYEEELCRTKEENHRQRQMLDSVWNPTVLLNRADVHQHLGFKEVVLEQQEWNPIVDPEEPEASYIKEEQEELWTSQEANIAKFTSTLFLVKSDDDELNQTQTEENKVEANKVDCGESEPVSSFHPYRHLQRKTNQQNEDSDNSDEDQTLNHKQDSNLPTNSSTEQMETETDDNGGASEPDNLVHMENVKRRTFDSQSLLEEHVVTRTEPKLVDSPECEATFSQKKNTIQETNPARGMMMKNYRTVGDLRSKKNRYYCFVCLKTFCWKSKLEIHMRVHTGEKPFSCSECSKRYTWKIDLERHMRAHTGERPFSCVVCQKRFTRKYHLESHMKTHSSSYIGEKPFHCVVCQKRFIRKYNLMAHMMKIHGNVHIGQRPFRCSVCQRDYSRKQHLKIHMKSHRNSDTGKRPFPCGVSRTLHT